MWLLDSVRNAKLRPSPFVWALVDPCGPEAVVAELAQRFPREGFEHVERLYGDAGHGKPYRMHTRKLVDRSEGLLRSADLAPCWIELGGTVTGAEYRRAVSRLTGVDLEGASLEAVFWRYDPGCWLGPHTDKSDKLVTQILNLSPTWEGHWGGNLRILNSSDIDDVCEEIAPRANTSVLLVRSEESWHAVTPVKGEGAATPSRQVLTITFYR